LDSYRPKFILQQAGGQAMFAWDDGWPTSYTNWGPNEPNQFSLDAGSGCVVMKK